MTTPARLAAALAVAAVTAALPFARTPAIRPAAGHPPAARTPVSSDPPLTASFSTAGLSFRYPATWHSGTWSDVSSFAALIVYLSPSQLHNPCTVTTTPTQISATCADPVGKLPPGGVLVRWSDDGTPGFHLPRTNAMIAGRPALQTTSTGDYWCAEVGGTTTITALIPRDVPDNTYEMDACLRPPGLPRQEAQISALLSTVRIAQGD
jgi:hypothetical protein